MGDLLIVVQKGREGCQGEQASGFRLQASGKPSSAFGRRGNRLLLDLAQPSNECNHISRLMAAANLTSGV